jgi:hypothetical protein
MWYEINVSRNGAHWFATSERSLTDKTAASVVFRDICSRFPTSEGFNVTMDLKCLSGRTVAQRGHDGLVIEMP